MWSKVLAIFSWLFKALGLLTSVSGLFNVAIYGGLVAAVVGVFVGGSGVFSSIRDFAEHLSTGLNSEFAQILSGVNSSEWYQLFYYALSLDVPAGFIARFNASIVPFIVTAGGGVLYVGLVIGIGVLCVSVARGILKGIFAGWGREN